MADILAVTGSITSATRLARELEASGCLACRVVHTPTVLSPGGCSYSVKISEDCFSKLLEISSRSKIKIKMILRERMKDGEYIYDNLS